MEHSGGDGWTILPGDLLNLMRSFESGVFDAVIPDPPYASGGASQTAKNRTTNQKYSSMSPDKAGLLYTSSPDRLGTGLESGYPGPLVLW